MGMLFSDEAMTCEDCYHQGFRVLDGGAIGNPGKFEGESISTFHAYHIMLDGFADDSDGAAWLVGNMICEESNNGFVSADIYNSDEAAREIWERLGAINYREQQ
jgi:hypothetical protein